MDYLIIEFIQGQTDRWAVGWSFTDMHLPDVSCLNRPFRVDYNQAFPMPIAWIPSIVAGHPLYQRLPFRNTLIQLFPNYSFSMLLDIVDKNLRLLDGVSTNTESWINQYW